MPSESNMLVLLTLQNLLGSLTFRTEQSFSVVLYFCFGLHTCLEAA